MGVLALDTAGHACSVARISSKGEVLFQKTTWMARGHGAALAPMVQAALNSSEAGIGAVAVTRGPGGFTGVRAGLSYARAFGLGKGIPVYGFDVFMALRLSLGADTPILIDTRRGDFFYDGPTAKALDLPESENIGIIKEPAEVNGPLGGSIWRTPTIEDWAAEAPHAPGWIEPCPVALAKAALEKLHHGITADRADLSPLYVRDPSVG